MLKFSIITINLNNASGLLQTINSVKTQTFDAFEHILIDGGSSDSSKDLLANYSKQSSYRVNWLSEPDKGIYSAMNKGITRAQGVYLLFLNSGDFLMGADVLAECDRLIDSDAELCSGVLYMGDQEDRFVLNPVNELTLSYSMNDGLTHPNTFIKKSLFEKYGLYNENNKIVSDWEFFLVAGGLHEVNYQSIAVPVSCFMPGGISSSSNNSILTEERERAIASHVPVPILKDVQRLNIIESTLRESGLSDFIYALTHYRFLTRCLVILLKILIKLDKRIRKIILSSLM